MAKYRLSYLGYGGYKSIDLEKLECLKGQKVTDIKVIDELTTSFNNLEELLTFLKRNKLVDNEVKKLYITVDKNDNGKIINKKIYRGENLLFKSDRNFLDISFVYKWIMNNINKSDLIIDICNNYIEKYKNAYNRINGSSYILNVFNTLCALAYNKKNKADSYVRAIELKEFYDCVEEFINLEFYKIYKDILIKEKYIKRKREPDGSYKKSYRNIHDFIILLKSLGVNLNKCLNEEYLIKKQELFVVTDNVEELVGIDIDIKEEFLTEEDIIRATQDTIYPKKWDEKTCTLVPIERKTEDEDYESYQDSIDYYHKMNRTELEEVLYETGMNLCLKPCDGDLK